MFLFLTRVLHCQEVSVKVHLQPIFHPPPVVLQINQIRVCPTCQVRAIYKEQLLQNAIKVVQQQFDQYEIFRVDYLLVNSKLNSHIVF